MVFWWFGNPYFDTRIANGSKCHTVRAVPHWYVGVLVAQKPVFLNRQFPMVQSLIPSGMSPTAIRVLWWLRKLYFESQIPHCSTSNTVRDVPPWYLGALVAQMLL